MSAVFDAFEDRERHFNAVFSTIIAMTISIAIGGLLADAGVFRSSDTWSIIVVLIAIPIITFLVTDNETEFRTAYYKSWCDILQGWYDSKRVMKRFFRQYKIPKWRRYTSKLKVDKRWNYHIETEYMDRLLNQRELLLDKVLFEYSVLLSDKIEMAKKAEHDLNEANIRLGHAEEIGDYTEVLLNKAKSSGEIYKQRRDYRDINETMTQYKLLKNDAESGLELARKHIVNIYDCYRLDVCKIERVFNVRYSKYLNQVVKKLNKIEGLKYTTVMMPGVDAWLKKIERREDVIGKN